MRSARGHSIIELGIAVFLLIMLGFLSANVYVIWTAKDYNDKVCRDSIMLAAKEALEGKDKQDVINAARGGMDGCGIGGFFIAHPRFTYYSDDVTSDVRVLKISTATEVRIPLPFLVVNPKLNENGRLDLVSTYEYRITNPKEIGAENKNSSEPGSNSNPKTKTD